MQTAEARVDECEKVAAIAGPTVAVTQGSSSASSWQGPKDVRTGLACGLMGKHGKALRDPVRPAVSARRKRSAIRPRFIRFQVSSLLLISTTNCVRRSADFELGPAVQV
jgi:hypothetical protein